MAMQCFFHSFMTINATAEGSQSASKTPLRKHAYSNILKILPPTNEKKNQIKIRIFFIFLLNIDCGYSYEYPQSMFLSRNKNKNVYPCKPQFYYIKGGGGGWWALRGSKFYRRVFMMHSFIFPLIRSSLNKIDLSIFRKFANHAER